MITEENKNLLFRDLSSRFSYGVKVVHTTLSDNMPKVWDVIGLPAVGLVDIVVPGKYRFAAVPVEEIKPYLRLMDSMTEEEQREFGNLVGLWKNPGTSRFVNRIPDLGEFGKTLITEIIIARAIDWLNAHHLDYRGLIEKDLAIKAPEGMYE